MKSERHNAEVRVEVVWYGLSNESEVLNGKGKD